MSLEKLSPRPIRITWISLKCEFITYKQALFDSEENAKEKASQIEPLIKPPTAWIQERFIDKHLYYLKNPSKATDPWFVTFHPTKDEGPLRICQELEENSSSSTEWTVHYSEFNSQEFFAIIGCLFIHFTASIARILFHSGRDLDSRSASLGRSVNVKANALDGNSFEVSAAVFTVGATQYTLPDVNGSPIFSFSGLIGTEFVKNVINEMCYSSNRPLNVDFHEQLKGLLQSI